MGRRQLHPLGPAPPDRASAGRLPSRPGLDGGRRRYPASAAPATVHATLPPRSRLSEVERHQTLREAAETVFLREGYAATHMDDVARAAGMSKRTLYQIFPSKAALFEAVVEGYLAPLRIDSELEEEPDLVKALTVMLEVAARHLLAPRQSGIYRLIVAEVNRSPELANAFHRAGLGRGASSLERRIAAEAERGRLRVSNPEDAANMLFGMAIGTIHSKMLLGLRGPPDEEEISARVREAVTVFLRGTMTHPG